MKIFIVHYDKLIKRKEHLLNQLNIHNLFDFEFISNYGKDKLTFNDKKMFKNLSDGEISVTLHHIECFKKIINYNIDYALIFEDDVILDNNFVNNLNKYLEQLPNDWDMFFIGDGCNLHINKNELKTDKYVYKKDNIILGKPQEGATRCLDSYLIKHNCAKKIIEKLELPNYTIYVPADHWLNCVIRNNNFNVYWAEPTIVSQGSEKNIYKSSLR
jgi:glycosyl transferase family 25